MTLEQGIIGVAILVAAVVVIGNFIRNKRKEKHQDE